MNNIIEYVEKLFTGMKPYVGFILALLHKLLFPDSTYFNAAVAVGIAMLLDLLTKMWSIAKINGGYIRSVKIKALYSKTLWEKTSAKFIAYFCVAILAGLSYRVTPLANVGVFFATVVYSVMFLRETQSVIENLCDAGADLKWLAKWAKKKEKTVLEEKEEKNNERI